MLPQNVILALASAGLVSALPLNINLGAFSPALVVGDGEISLGNAESAGNLMETLASGAATASMTAGEAAQPAGEAAQPAGEGAQPAGEGATQAQGVTTGPNPALTGQTAEPPNPAEGAAPAPEAGKSEILPEQPQAAVVDVDPQTEEIVGGMISKGLEPSLKIPALPRPNMEKRLLDTREPAISSSKSSIIKREINGFREALNFAMNAMKNQPTIELGTGEDRAGVGILVNPGVNVAAGTPASGRVQPVQPGAEARKEKRYVTPGAGLEAESPRSGITLMAIAEI